MLKLILLDASVVINLFSIGLWDDTVDRFEIVLAQTVLEREALYYEKDSEHIQIDLTEYVENDRISIVDVPLSKIREFVDQLDPTYIDRMDPGESESLAYLQEAQEGCLICSSDGIVFKVLGRLGCSERGISLEEMLDSVGLSRSVEYQYSKSFRERYTRLGQVDMISNFDSDNA